MAQRERTVSPVSAGVEPAVPGGLLLWLSGADRRTLAKCPSERGKFVGIGGVILTTATLATVSASFALITGARTSLGIAVTAGLLWGLAIMNLDRWLVSATARRDRWYQNLVMTFPRLLLAFIIGLVISTPLVLWIFQREIDAHLNVRIEAKSKAFQEQLNTNPRLAKITPLESDVARLRGIINGTVQLTANTELDRLRALRDNSKAAYETAIADSLAEWEGRGPSKRFGDGPIWREKKAIEEQKKTDSDKAEENYQLALTAAKGNFQKELEQKQAELSVYTTERDAQITAFEKDNQNDRGLLARLEALSSLTNGNVTLKSAYIALLLFITVIEVLPVLVKFLMTLGPRSLYDEVYAARHKTGLETAVAAFDYEKKSAIREFEIRQDREDEAAHEKIDEMISAEREVAGYQIRQWKEDQLGKRTSQSRRFGFRLRFWSARRDRPQAAAATEADGYARWPDPE